MHERIMHLVGVGVDEEGLQRCIFCGRVMADLSPDTLSRTLTTQPAHQPQPWPSGPVTVSGNVTVAGELPEAHWCTEVAKR